MSWSASAEVTVHDGGEPSFRPEHEQLQTGNGEAESAIALAAAKQAAVALIQTGKFGKGTFKVNMSGHANDGNKPTAGWSNDFLSITVQQI